jgi:hypothetical protein
MKHYVGVYEITPPRGTDTNKFEQFMTTEIFPTINYGLTRVGSVQAQWLLRGQNKFLWIIEAEGIGEQVVRAAGRPEEAEKRLENFGASTSFTVSEPLLKFRPEKE